MQGNSLNHPRVKLRTVKLYRLYNLDYPMMEGKRKV